jgi:alpha-L-fucosidase
MEPHTGHLDGRDYLKDIQEAHMKILAEKYDTDIMVSTEP